MALLAIQGHSTRGKEVISYLKMLGGKNPYNCNGLGTLCVYYIIDGNIQIATIEDLFRSNEYTLYNLEGILAKFPYKVGDKVIYENKRREITKMVWEEQTNTIAYKLDDKLYCNVINKLQPYKKETMEDKPNLLQQLKDYFDNTPREVVEKEWHQYDKYNEIGPKVNEYLEYVNNIRQPKYPKTYEDCCKVLGCKANHFFTDFSYNGYEVEISDYENKIDDLLQNFRRLRYCRDAYWKIAGEQMGLGKPWEPDWLNNEQDKYVLFTHNNAICSNRYVLGHNILAFPTEEMRDAFYENFKELIEACKELL